MNRRVGTRAFLCLWFVVLPVQSALAAIGHTPGEIAVTVQGTGSYRIPLSLPPGTNGLAAELTLAYEHTIGNGLLGMGWSIEGHSVIARCPQTVAQDGAIVPLSLTGSDRFCFNGNRLRRTGGTYGGAGSTYQTEIETFARFTANSVAGTGPQSFTVEQKNGLIYEYGHTTDSRIEGTGGATVREWALNRIRDRSGNYIDFTYFEDTANGSYRPTEIRWTGNTGAGTAWIFRVRFVYETSDRSDPPIRYFVGQKIKQVKRLERIEIDHGTTTVVRKYVVSYGSPGATGRSRLSQIQECDGSGSQCLSPTTLAWRPYSPGWGTESTQPVVSSFEAALMVDVNGDGRDDYVWFNLNTGTWHVQFANSSGSLDSAVNTGFGNALYYNRALPADVDGDGRREILVPGVNGTNWWWLRYTTGTSFAYSDTGAAATGSAGDAWVVDMDGDARDDLIWAERGPSNHNVRVRLNTTTGGVASFSSTASVAFTTAWPEERFADTEPFGNKTWLFRRASRVVDLDGDGRSDLLVSIKYNTSEGGTPSWTYYWKTLVSTGSAFGSGTIFSLGGNLVKPYPGDFNGDGLVDIAYYLTSSWRIRFATGTGGFAASVNTGQGTANSGSPLITDWDGDGRADILTPGLTPGSTNWLYLKSTGETLLAATDTGIVSTGATFSPKVADIDGDGLLDLVYAASTSDATRLRLHNGPSPDLIQTVTDGFGNFATFTFAPLTDSSVYTKLSGSTWPIRDIQGPSPVVKQYVASTGAVSPESSSYTVSFKYEGGRAHALGRGALGFARRSSTDSRTNIYTEENYSQDVAEYQRIGLPTSTYVKRSAAGTMILDTAFTWQRHDYSPGTFDERRFPYTSQTIAKNHEVDGPISGTLVSTVTTSAVYDTWGTATTKTEVIKEENTGLNPTATHTRQVTQYNVNNDPFNWCFGRPESTIWSNQHTLAGGTQISRTTNYLWDMSKCRVTQEKVAPGSDLEVTSDYAYDTFGNIYQITVTPKATSGQPARTTVAGWGTDGRFPRTITNAEGHVQQITWDVDGGGAPTQLGLPRAITDPNNLVTTLEHDPLGRPSKQIRPDGTAIQWDYLACDSDCTGIAGAHHKMRRTFKNNTSGTVISENFAVLDSLGREVRSTHFELAGGKADVLAVYSAAGWLIKHTQPHFTGSGAEWATLTTDQLGRVTQETRSRTNDNDASAHSQSFSYEGLLTRFTDAAGKVTLRYQDGARNVIKIVEAYGLGAQTQALYEHDAFGNLLKTTDAAGNATTLTYFNERGWKKTLSDPDMGGWL